MSKTSCFGTRAPTGQETAVTPIFWDAQLPFGGGGQIQGQGVTRIAGRLALAEGDSRLSEVVRRHLDVYFVTDADTDEILPHLAGDMSEDLMAIR